MSVIINLTEGNQVTIQKQEPPVITLENAVANEVTVTQGDNISVSLQNVTANQVNITQQDNIGVTLENQSPMAVTVSNGLSGGGSWGSITGTITDQTDLVTYVNRTRTSFDMQSQDGSVFTIVVNNAGQLLVIPEGSTAPTIVGIPTISGTEAVWYTLLAVPASVTGSPTPTRAWQWQRSTNGTDWVDIAGATSINYLLVDLDGNNYIRVKQTESNVLGSVTAESLSTGVIFPSNFSTTQWQNINPIFWEQLTAQTWN